jgi:hypothetical protein
MPKRTLAGRPFFLLKDVRRAFAKMLKVCYRIPKHRSGFKTFNRVQGQGGVRRLTAPPKTGGINIHT